MSTLKKLSRIAELQTQLYTKQKEFTMGLRNKMPHQELKVLNEQISTIHQELLTLRSTASSFDAVAVTHLHTASAKLIFVDDDDDDRALIKEGLATLLIDRFAVLDSGAALFDYLRKLSKDELPEAIILDLNMPQMGGMDVLRVLKNMDGYETIPVYILTTASSSSMKQSCIAEGAADYYIKPNTLVGLFDLLNTIHSTVMN